MHAILPIPGKGESDWNYAPIPVIGPLLGASLAAVASVAMK
jgi:glycerol uptake facilitator protein